MENSKDYHDANHQVMRSEHVCPSCLGVRVTRETQHNKALDGTTLSLRIDETGKDQF